MAAKYTRYTAEEIDILRRYYPKIGVQGVLQMFNIKKMYGRTATSVKAACQRLGIKTEKGGRFQHGHIPANKGAKQTDEVLQKMQPTMFKPGNQPVRILPVGSKSKRKEGYWFIKVAMPNKWVRLHHWLWEQQYGKVPKGWVVVFKDANADNVCLENLELISRATLIARNANIPKRGNSIKEGWKRRKRHQLRQKYGSLSAAMAAGEKL